MGKTLRLFVAVYPPPERAEAMLEAARRIGERGGAPAWRLTPLAQIHLTLQFIGDRREGELDETLESVRRSGAGIGGFVLTPRRMVTLPERPPTRLIAVETDAPAPLLELQRRLAARLARRARREAGDRFRPHLTVCRFRGDSASFVVDEAVEVGGFEVREIVVVASVLSAGGAEHRAIERVGLD
jgi:2'-5' RNA ligase